MNNLDFLPQKMVRRSDPQTTKVASGSSDGQDRGANGNGDEFNSLLKDIGAKDSAGTRAQGAARQPPETPTTGVPTGNGTSKGGDEAAQGGISAIDLAIEDLLEVVNGGPSQDVVVIPDNGQGSNTNSALAALESLLPQILGQNGEAGGENGQEATGGRGTGAALQRTDLTAEGYLDAPSTPSVMVSVKHQETHFKPVIEGFTTKVVAPEQASGDGEAAGPEELFPALGVKPQAAKASGPTMSSVLPAGLSQGTAAGAAEPGEAPELRAIRVAASERTAGKVESVSANSEMSPKGDQTSTLASGTFNRIANAIAAEAAQMRSEVQSSAFHAEAARFMTSAKASESAVRMLNIQLHPADLGLITVKMKLTGDNLEMELQVSNEETARLLKTDSEKLSNLLKGSGYRPDIITVQTAPSDTKGQDGSSFGRQQATSQGQQEAFQRGEQQQNGGSQQRDPGYQNERKQGRDDASIDGNHNGRSTGGVYL